MSARRACGILNSAQAQYGMSGAQGRAALRQVVAGLASTGVSGQIRQAALGELAHPPVNNVSQYNADWVNDCLGVTGSPSPAANLLTCSTVVDPGVNLTAQHVIADLETMLLVDGIKNIEPGGTPSVDDTGILDTAALDLANYSGTQLANDASQFVSDEQNYNPSSPVDDTYASAVQADIRTLLKDCPRAAAEGIRQAG